MFQPSKILLEESKKTSKHIVYLLSSTTTKRTYVGYTVDIERRLRQHNGIIKGGAKYTKNGRPWIVSAIVEGFPNKTTALQFEWRAHHPTKYIRSYLRRQRFASNTERRLACFEKIFEMERFTSKCIPTKELQDLQIRRDIKTKE